jgi:hypothetical protein
MMNYLTDFRDYFWLRKSKPLVSGKVPIYLRLERRGKRKDISTRLACWESDWNGESKLLNPDAPDSKSINAALNNWRLIVHRSHENLKKYRRITLEEVRKEIFREEYQYGLVEFFVRRIKDLMALEGKGYRKTTIANYKACRKHLSCFISTKWHRDDIGLRLIDAFF